MKNYKIAEAFLIMFVIIIMYVGLYKSHNHPMQEIAPSDVGVEIPIHYEPVTYIEVKGEEEKENKNEIFVPTEVPLIRTSAFVNLTFEEMDLLEHIAMAEAEGEDTIGKALVMCAVLNRSRRDGEDIYNVIYRDGQFCIERMYIEPTEDCHEALAMVMDGWNESMLECNEHKDMMILFFGRGYSQYGEPMFQYGGHCFSGYKRNEE